MAPSRRTLDAWSSCPLSSECHCYAQIGHAVVLIEVLDQDLDEGWLRVDRNGPAFPGAWDELLFDGLPICGVVFQTVATRPQMNADPRPRPVVIAALGRQGQ